jgi:hypothetical protein
VIQQLRIYEVFEHNKAAFHARFHNHAMPIMARHGFRILRTWETSHDGRTEFAYILEWPDVVTKERAWRAFAADEQWKEVKRATSAVHGDLVGAIEDRVLTETDYSPAFHAPIPLTSGAVGNKPQ